jgi:hypothetical protein
MKKQLLLVCAGADEASTSSASPDITLSGLWRGSAL